jgi:hypothetical protein
VWGQVAAHRAEFQDRSARGLVKKNRDGDVTDVESRRLLIAMNNLQKHINADEEQKAGLLRQESELLATAIDNYAL